MKDEAGKSKGFGFVCFTDWQDAWKVLQDYQSQEESKKETSLYVREQKTKDERQREIAKQSY